MSSRFIVAGLALLLLARWRRAALPASGAPRRPARAERRPAPRRGARARGARARLGGPGRGAPDRVVPRRADLSDRRGLVGGDAHLVLAAPPWRRDARERLLLPEPDLRDLPRRAAARRVAPRPRLPRRGGRRPRDLARPARLARITLRGEVGGPRRAKQEVRHEPVVLILAALEAHAARRAARAEHEPGLHEPGPATVGTPRRSARARRRTGSAEPRPHLVGEPRHRLEHLGPRARPAVEGRVRRPEGHGGLEPLDHLG